MPEISPPPELIKPPPRLVLINNPTWGSMILIVLLYAAASRDQSANIILPRFLNLHPINGDSQRQVVPNGFCLMWSFQGVEREYYSTPIY